MNFLAHIFLSGSDRELMLGNFIADFVKGNKKNSYPERIRQGIELHRMIDDFTDHHPVTAMSKSRLYGTHRKYAGVVVDIFYDHFLAKNFNNFSDKPLLEYTLETYKIIQEHKHFLPEKVNLFLPYMIERNWLFNYSTIGGIARTLEGLSKRVAFANKMHLASSDLSAYYSEFEEEFNSFFPELINFAEERK
jgi:acyl carrier protein phosphodiesterase